MAENMAQTASEQHTRAKIIIREPTPTAAPLDPPLPPRIAGPSLLTPVKRCVTNFFTRPRSRDGRSGHVPAPDRTNNAGGEVIQATAQQVNGRPLMVMISKLSGTRRFALVRNCIYSLYLGGRGGCGGRGKSGGPGGPGEGPRLSADTIVVLNFHLKRRSILQKIRPDAEPAQPDARSTPATLTTQLGPISISYNIRDAGDAGYPHTTSRAKNG